MRVCDRGRGLRHLVEDGKYREVPEQAGAELVEERDVPVIRVDPGQGWLANMTSRLDRPASTSKSSISPLTTIWPSSPTTWPRRGPSAPPEPRRIRDDTLRRRASAPTAAPPKPHRCS